MTEWVLHILIFSINLAKTENFWAICSFSNSLMIRHSINCPLCWNSTNGCAAVSTEFPRNWKFRGEPKSLHHLLFSSILRTFHTFFADSSIFSIFDAFCYQKYSRVGKTFYSLSLTIYCMIGCGAGWPDRSTLQHAFSKTDYLFLYFNMQLFPSL